MRMGPTSRWWPAICDPQRMAGPDLGPGDAAQSVFLASLQKPIDDFVRDERDEKRAIGCVAQKPRQPHHSIQQQAVERADVTDVEAGSTS